MARDFLAATLVPAAAAHGGQRRARDARPSQARAALAVAGAMLWLLIGCCGLLWTIAFTTDPRSMSVGLAVWVFCFVAPSMLATLIAYRIDERAPAAQERRGHRRPRMEPASAGD